MIRERATPVIRYFAAILAVSCGVSCQVPHIPDEELPVISGGWDEEPAAAEQTLPRVSRQEAIRTARRYASHRWTPTKANVWHGYDEQGVRVDTPDESFKVRGLRPGWWRVGEENQGVPYQWGGFSSLAEFDQGVANGYAAGDILTMEKRVLMSQGASAISEAAVGIDASGFISRCWKLNRNYSTRELPNICVQLPSYDELKPGDVLNLKGVHVILFEQFADVRKKGLLGYEAGAPPSWKVLYDQLPVSHLKRLGYQPLRLRHITGSPDDAKVLGLNAAQPPVIQRPPVEPDPVPVPGPLAQPDAADKPVPGISVEDPNAPFL